MSDLDLIARAKRDHQRRDDLETLAPRFFAYRHEMQAHNPAAAAQLERLARRRAVADRPETAFPDYPQR